MVFIFEFVKCQTRAEFGVIYIRYFFLNYENIFINMYEWYGQDVGMVVFMSRVEFE